MELRRTRFPKNSSIIKNEWTPDLWKGAKETVVCWWSGGITSAVATKIAIEAFGRNKCKVVMINTQNEDEDTYRFKNDCEAWYDKPIHIITAIGEKYKSIQDVWIRHKSLNVSTGAICSTELKRKVRESWQRNNTYDHQIFGFEFSKNEFNRSLSLKINHPDAKSIYPLLMMAYDKAKCVEIVTSAGIPIPNAYKMGFKNNNCLRTGCVQGGVGYWQKMQTDFPDKFNTMAEMEHYLTNLKNQPVTMLKNQSAEAKLSGNVFVFLKKHPSYPNLKCIDEMPRCKVEPLFECNGFCGVNDLTERKSSEQEINFQ